MVDLLFKSDLATSYASEYAKKKIYFVFDILYTGGNPPDIEQFGYYGNLQCVRHILDSSKRVSKKKYLRTQILLGAGRANHTDIINLFPDKSADDWHTVLSGACRGGHVPLVMLVIQNSGASYNSALTLACYHGQLSIVEYLFSAKPNALDLDGTFCLACESGYLNIAKYLYRIAGSALNLDKALYYSTCDIVEHPDVVEYLTQIGAQHGFQPSLFD